MKTWIRESRFGQWMLNRACVLHLKDPRRFTQGPAQCNLWGWIYFRALCGIRRSVEHGT